jgi:hypothetical protein
VREAECSSASGHPFSADSRPCDAAQEEPSCEPHLEPVRTRRCGGMATDHVDVERRPPAFACPRETSISPFLDGARAGACPAARKDHAADTRSAAPREECVFVCTPRAASRVARHFPTEDESKGNRRPEGSKPFIEAGRCKSSATSRLTRARRSDHREHQNHACDCKAESRPHDASPTIRRPSREPYRLASPGLAWSSQPQGAQSLPPAPARQAPQ